jgi:hypothetical protein
MKCRRSEELWSDYLEGTLPRPLRKDLEGHLAECPHCPSLLSTFREVVNTLEGLPHPKPAPELVQQIVAASRPKLASLLQPVGAGSSPWSVLSWGNWAAWGAAAAMVVILFLGPSQAVSRVNQLGHQVYSFGLGVYRDTEGLIDELNVLRMTVGVAFEDRLDRLNQRLKDLEEARRKNGDDSNQSSNLGWQRMITRLRTETTSSRPCMTTDKASIVASKTTNHYPLAPLPTGSLYRFTVRRFCDRGSQARSL